MNAAGTKSRPNPYPPPLPHKGAVSPKRRMRLVMSYAPDWVITIAVTGLFYILGRIHGYWRHFSVTDTSIQYPYATKERVPDWLLVILSLVVPILIMPVINLITIRSYWDLHNAWLGLVLSWGLTGTITNIVKVVAGRPRPDLIARCQLPSGVHDAPVFGLVDPSVCRNTDISVLRDGFRSFFSGHASLSFAGLGFLFWYGAGKFHLFDRRGHAGKAWIALVPLLGATLISITRTMDYRHHPIDVFIGAVVGLVISHFGYRQYYPSLTDPLSHRPYSPRVPREEEEIQVPLTGVEAETSGSSAMPGPDDTVQRQNPGLQTLWRQGSNGQEGTVPRPVEGEASRAV